MEAEFLDLVQFHFERLTDKPEIMECLPPQELAYRLWNYFRWRGYIDPDMTYELPEVEMTKFYPDHATSLREVFLYSLDKARKQGLRRPDVMKKTAEKFERELFQSLPKDVVQEFMKTYSLDFELFGYEI